jgi:heme exporter protein C
MEPTTADTKRVPFGIAGALLFAAVFFGLIVTLADEYLHADLSLGLPVGARTLIAVLSALAGAIIFLAAENPDRPTRAGGRLIIAGVVLLAVGAWFGLFVAPPEQFMGEVQRIMYVHVPTAWNALLAMTFAFACAIFFLFGGAWKWDARMEASIWAKPTWGVWWDWDPRLTTTAVLLFAFLGILALRKFVEDPVKRGIWSSVATIIAYADVPIVYFSVRWWNSLHQMQSNPNTVSKPFWIPLRASAFGILFLMTGFILVRSRISALRLAGEMAPPPVLEAGLGEAVV